MADIQHMTKQELIDFLSKHGEPCEGTKADLFLRAEAVVNQARAQFKDIPSDEVKQEQPSVSLKDFLGENSVKSEGAKSHGSKSQGSRHSSMKSTLSSLRAKVLMKKAAIMAGAKMAEERDKLEMEELQLKQRHRQLQIKTELAVAEAEEEVVSRFEREEEADNVACSDKTSKRKQVEAWLHDQRKTTRLNPEAESWVPQPEVQPAQTNDAISSSLVTLMEVMSLPKTELSSFSGDPLEYWHFITSFEEAIGSKSVPDTTKLNQLLQLCKGDAYDAIKCCAIGTRPGRYVQAKRILQERFGEEHLIVCKWLATLTEGPAIRRGDGRGLQKIADDVHSCAVTLEAMGKLSEMDNKSCMRLLVDRLPPFLKSRWMSKVMDGLDKTGSYPGIKEFSKFLNRVAREVNDPVYEGVSSLPKTSSASAKKEKSTSSRSFKTTVQEQAESDEQSGKQCCLCEQKHELYSCKKFKQLGATERLDLVRSKKLCFLCLSPRHFTSKCKANVCDINGCKGKHSRLLHEAFRNRNKACVKDEADSAQKTEDKAGSSFSCSVKKETTSCPIVKVNLMSSCGQKQIQTYAMLDNWSDKSFCSIDLIQELGLKGSHQDLNITTMTGESHKNTMTVEMVVFPHNARKSTNPTVLKGVHALKDFPCVKTHAVRREELSRYKHMRGIQLDLTDKVEEVKLLVGMNNSDELIPLEVKKGGIGEPFAVRYALGWTLNGRKCAGDSASFFVKDDLTSLVQKFWSIDIIGTKKFPVSVDDERVLQLWDSTTKKDDGHYMLPIPFRKDPPCFPNNKIMVESRLKLLQRRLNKDSKLHQQYTESMNDMFEKGYAEKVEDPQKESKHTWYIPHQAVTNQRKPNKVRIVFDCAASFKESSLNKAVLPGPDLTNHLLGVLLRFRENAVAVCGDIEAMYNQVLVTQDHRDALRFLWFPDGNLQEEPVEYRMTRHLFGGCWSPAAASYALRRCAQDNQDKYSNEVVTAIRKNFYVDDCLKSLNTEESAMAFVREVTSILVEGGFRIRKWSSNSREVLHAIPQDMKTEGLKNINLAEDDLPVEATLGMIWNPENDQLMVRTNVKDRPMTRRGLLSVLGSVFDPLGILAPVVLKGKILFQAEVRQRKGWDDPLEDEVENQWREWQKTLPRLENFSIKRCLMSSAKMSDVKGASLHIFCDASEAAYGVVAYLQYVNSDDKRCCSFVMSKTRLAPLKTLTIPRLELCAAVLGVDIAETLHGELELVIKETTFWTDSSIVLCYINSTNKRFKTFVANRISRIHEVSDPRQWKYVSTTENPADVASRGLMPEQMLRNSKWIQGPEFLLSLEPEINVGAPVGSDDDVLNLEVASQAVSVVTKVKQEGEDNSVEKFISYFSSWNRLCLAAAWLSRFWKYMRLKSKDECPSGSMTVPEIQSARNRLLTYVQTKFFPDEIKQVKLAGSIAKKSPLHKLPLILKEDVLCLKGRVEQKSNPAILPKDHWISTLILRHYHKMSLHAGKEHVVSLCLQHYWIIGIRGKLKGLACIHCRKRDGQPMGQRMADLPPDRTVSDNPPFTYVGVDCFGPFSVKRGRSEVKWYGCLFTCLSMRAVHIEVLPSMETDTFLNALQRFITLRGAPKMIRCDNGTNFAGAEREIRERLLEMDKLKIERKMRDRDIEWRFNTPKSSNAGGAWERMIRCVRRALYSALKEHSTRLDEDGLRTAMCLAAAAVNNRPLTTVSTDPDDFRPLSPNDLILLRTSDFHLPGYWEEKDLYRRQYRRVQYIADLFWRRWTREYLPALQERQKWHVSCQNLKEDDVVLVLDDLPRNQWRLGRVVKVFSGQDGLVRTVQVRTATTILLRPVRKLCLLEAS
jgi:hypothetical protein